MEGYKVFLMVSSSVNSNRFAVAISRVMNIQWRNDPWREDGRQGAGAEGAKLRKGFRVDYELQRGFRSRTKNLFLRMYS